MAICKMCSRMKAIRFKGGYCGDCGYGKQVAFVQAVFAESGGHRMDAASNAEPEEGDQRARVAQPNLSSCGTITRLISGLAILALSLISPDYDSEDTASSKEWRSKMGEMPRFSVL